MARSTLNTRIQALAQDIFTAMGTDFTPSVESGRYSPHAWNGVEKHSTDKVIRIQYGHYTKRGNLLVAASVLCAVARKHGLRAGWRDEFTRGTVVISFSLDYGEKASTACSNASYDFSGLAGFDAKTHADLQLFGGQGLNREDTQRLFNIIG